MAGAQRLRSVPNASMSLTAASESGKSDLPSRGLVSEAAQVVKGRVRVLDEASILVANLWQACDDLPWDLLSKSAGKSLPTFFV